MKLVKPKKENYNGDYNNSIGSASARRGAV